MVYRLTKFFLYLILSICVVWGVLILVGPRLINYAVDHYFGQSVKVSGLEVSPKFQIYASRVDYAGADFGSLGRVHGYSRAVTVRLDNLLGLNPNLYVSLGPSRANGVFEFNELISKISYSQAETLDTLNIFTKIEGFAGKDLVFEQLEAEAIVSSNLSKVNSLKYNFTNITSALPFKINASNIVGELVDVVFDNKTVQSFKIAFNDIINLNINDGINGGSLSFNNVSSNGNYFDKKLQYSLNFDEIFLGSEGGLAKDVSIVSNHITAVDKSKGRSEFTIDTLYLPEFAAIKNGASLSSVSGSAEFNGFNLQSAQIEGRLNSLTIQNESFFLAKIPEGILKVNLQFANIEANNNLGLEVALYSNKSEDLTLTADLDVSFDQRSLMACIYASCLVSELSAQYSIDVMNSMMTGAIYCQSADCVPSRFSHRVETKNTADFFNAIAAAKLINPILLASIYSEIMRGEKNGQGHIKDF